MPVLSYSRFPPNTKLKGYRVMRGYTQRGLAAAIGKSHAWVANVERGRTIPRKADAVRISSLLNVPVSQLFDEFNLNGIGRPPSKLR